MGPWSQLNLSVSLPALEMKPESHNEVPRATKSLKRIHLFSFEYPGISLVPAQERSDHEVILCTLSQQIIKRNSPFLINTDEKLMDRIRSPGCGTKALHYYLEFKSDLYLPWLVGPHCGTLVSVMIILIASKD